jgi:hypothetical protein
VPGDRVVLSPSESDGGRAWLGNFAYEDQPTARLLVDSLRIVTEDELRVGILSKLDELVAILPTPILILPIRDLRDFSSPTGSHHLVVYRDFSPFADFKSAPGSEVIAANIIRDMLGIRIKDPRFLNPSSSLEDLRASRCRALVLVEDYSGSGSQALHYLKSWLRNPTIRSWRSFGWLKIHLVLFAVSSIAAKRLRSSSAIDGLDFVEPAAEFANADWTKTELQSVIKLCTQYTEPTGPRRGEALGFAASKGLFVMQHTVPDNLPAIFVQHVGLGRRTWAPLFPNRIFPHSLQEQIAGYRPRNEFELSLDKLHDRRLAEALLRRPTGPDLPHLMMLALIAGHSSDDEMIASELATSTINIRKLGKALYAWGLIDRHRHLTDEGWLALRRARMKPRHVTFELKENESLYYPQRLRGVGDV